VIDRIRLVVYPALIVGVASTVACLRDVGRTNPEEVPDMFRSPPAAVAPAATRARDTSRIPPIDRELPARLETATFAFG
jgi:hypothetical protein